LKRSLFNTRESYLIRIGVKRQGPAETQETEDKSKNVGVLV